VHGGLRSDFVVPTFMAARGVQRDEAYFIFQILCRAIVSLQQKATGHDKETGALRMMHCVLHISSTRRY
jgi:hypothetical protein